VSFGINFGNKETPQKYFAEDAVKPDEHYSFKSILTVCKINIKLPGFRYFLPGSMAISSAICRIKNEDYICYTDLKTKEEQAYGAKKNRSYLGYPYSALSGYS
jgi:hypothetical protein